MVDILEWISGVLQECHTIRDDRFIDQLDTISLIVRSCSVELGELLHEMMLSPQPLDENQFSTLLELTQCVAELANYYGNRLLQCAQQNCCDTTNFTICTMNIIKTAWKNSTKIMCHRIF